jgi:hypothetical protein
VAIGYYGVSVAFNSYLGSENADYKNHMYVGVNNTCNTAQAKVRICVCMYVGVGVCTCVRECGCVGVCRCV